MDNSIEARRERFFEAIRPDGVPLSEKVEETEAETQPPDPIQEANRLGISLEEYHQG
jgi:hypothetical protein